MRLLLDTPALLWALADPQQLPQGARERIEDPGNDVLVSVATLWEIAIKQSAGKLALPGSSPQWLAGVLEQDGYETLPIEPGHAMRAGALAGPAPDVFARMLVAQAQLEDLVLVTPRAALRGYEVRSLWD